uniref:Uncharacterized protein n=1 Tax=Gasterosteus aculeatus TaxID=69293 RepID=G3NH95_GASAC
EPDVGLFFIPCGCCWLKGCGFFFSFAWKVRNYRAECFYFKSVHKKVIYRRKLLQTLFPYSPGSIGAFEEDFSWVFSDRAGRRRLLR